MKSKVDRTVRRSSRNALNHVTRQRSLEKEAWVEIQTSEGTWVEYQDNTNAEFSAQSLITRRPSRDSLAHIDLQEPPALSHISSPYITLAMPNSVDFAPYASSTNGLGRWDHGHSNLDFQLDIWTSSSPPITIENISSFFHPALIEGLGNLPSGRFLSSWDSSLAIAGPGYPRSRHYSAIGVSTQPLAQPGTLGQNPEFATYMSRSFQKLATVIPIQGLTASQESSLDMIPADGILSPTLYRLLIYSVMNGHISNCGIGLECIAKLLDHLKSVNFPFSRILQAFSGHAAKALAENLCRAAVKQSENRVLGTLLDTGYVDVNSIKAWNQNAIEYALMIDNADGARLLFDAGAQPNQYYRRYRAQLSYYHGDKKPGDWLLCEVLHWKLSSPRQTIKWLGLVDHLLNMGARLKPTNFSRVGWSFDEGGDICYRIASTVTLCQHSDFFANGCLWTLAHNLCDDRATEVMRSQVSDCAKKHGCLCLHNWKDVNYLRLLRAAERRLRNFVKSLLSYYTSAPPPDTFMLALLCASIKGGDTELIDYVLSYRPNINGIVDWRCPILAILSSSIQNHVSQTFPTSPFSEAIKANNELLIHRFEKVGILGSLGDVQRAVLAIESADEAGNDSYLRRLLSVSPILEGVHLNILLTKAVLQNDSTLVLALLEAGASIGNSRPTDDMNLHIKPLVTALDLHNTNLVRTLLNADNYGTLDAHVLRSAFRWGEKRIMDDILATFPLPRPRRDLPYTTIFIAHGEFELDRILPRNDYAFTIARALGSVLKDKKIFQYALDSKLATREILTRCLIVALHEDDSAMLQRFLDFGADASDKTAWEVASIWRQNMLPILARDLLERKDTVLTKGMGTELLKQVIRNGSRFATIAESQIRSGLVDIFHAGCDDPSITPLGVAIRECRFQPLFEPTVVIALLNAKCDPNSIVQWDGDAGINQTALLKAIEVDSLDLVKLLIDFGARVNEPPLFRVKRTPLQKAAEVGSLEIVRLLLERGAGVNGEPAFSRGGTALQFAAIGGNCNIAAELLHRGAQL